MINPQKVIDKLRRPPAVHNWVRNIKLRTDETARSLYETALNGPRHSLRPITDIIRNSVVDQIPDEQALQCLAGIKDPMVRTLGRQILAVALPYIRERGWRGVEVFRNLIGFYKVSRGVEVPVKPTFIINNDGRLTPYFVICWAKIDLSRYQRRILTTIVKDTILSLEEFEGSDAVFLCIPKHEFSKTERCVREWKVSDYEALNDEEKRDLFDRYGKALDRAEEMIIDALS